MALSNRAGITLAAERAEVALPGGVTGTLLAWSRGGWWAKVLVGGRHRRVPKTNIAETT